MKSLKTLIRESVRRILTEKIHGNLAIVYHASQNDPMTFAAYMNQGFKPGEGAGSMYGYGLYTVYCEEETLINSKSGQGFYGPHIYKLRADLNEFLIFDPEPCKKIHGKLLTLRQQLEKFNLTNVIREIESVGTDTEKAYLDVDLEENKRNNSGYSNNIPIKLKRFFIDKVNGVVFTGTHDGLVVVIFDPDRSAYLLSHSTTPLTADSKFDKKFGPFDDQPAIARKRAVLGVTQKGTYKDLQAKEYGSYNLSKLFDFQKRVSAIINKQGVSAEGIQVVEKVIEQMAEGQKDYHNKEQFAGRLRRAYVEELLKNDHENVLKFLNIKDLPITYYLFLDPVIGWPTDIGRHFAEMSLSEFTSFMKRYAKLIKLKFDADKAYKLIETVMYSLKDFDRMVKLETLKKAEIVHIMSSAIKKRDPEDLLFAGMIETHLRHNSETVGFKEDKYPTIDHMSQLILKEAKAFLSNFPEGDAKYGVEFFYADKLVDFRKIRYSSLRKGEYMINSIEDLQKICFFLMRHNIFSSKTVQKILMRTIESRSKPTKHKPRPGSGF